MPTADPRGWARMGREHSPRRPGGQGEFGVPTQAKAGLEWGTGRMPPGLKPLIVLRPCRRAEGAASTRPRAHGGNPLGRAVPPGLRSHGHAFPALTCRATNFRRCATLELLRRRHPERAASFELRVEGPCVPYQPAARSRQAGFMRLTSISFFSRRQFLICFSRSIAAPTV